MDRRSFIQWLVLGWAAFAAVVGGYATMVLRFFFPNVLFEPKQSFQAGYPEEYQIGFVSERWKSKYGVWIVFLAGFTPIPYKLVTVSAGMLSMTFWPFVIASSIGRGMRFFLVAGILYFGGEKMEHKIRQYVDVLGWLVVGLIVAYVAYKQF